MASEEGQTARQRLLLLSAILPPFRRSESGERSRHSERVRHPAPKDIALTHAMCNRRGGEGRGAREKIIASLRETTKSEKHTLGYGNWIAS